LKLGCVLSFLVIFHFLIVPLSKLKSPHPYADANSEEEFAKLHCYLSKEGCGRKVVHPLLGWVGKFSPDDYLHDKTKFIGSRRPILLYGDSFAHCMGGETCFQDILNSDEEFSKDHYLLNYGVIAYGLDQIYLLFHNSVNHYENPLIILSLYTEDLDRSILSFFSGQKPRFRIENDMLKLDNPSIINPDDYHLMNPPQIKSYFYRFILYSRISNYLPRRLVSFLTRENYYIQKKIKLNEKIILEIIKELRIKKLDYVFLIFHDSKNLLSNDWRSSFLSSFLENNNIPYIMSNKLIVENSKLNNIPLNQYYISDGHPGSLYNKVISEEIKKYVMNVEAK
jgi:hypothetical protein